MSDELPDDLVWLTPLRPGRGLLEPWLRRAAVAPDGLIFLTAALVGNETTVHLAAAWEDDVPIVYDAAGHAYVPSHWFAETFPSIAPSANSSNTAATNRWPPLRNPPPHEPPPT